MRMSRSKVKLATSTDVSGFKQVLVRSACATCSMNMQRLIDWKDTVVPPIWVSIFAVLEKEVALQNLYALP